MAVGTRTLRPLVRDLAVAPTRGRRRGFKPSFWGCGQSASGLWSERECDRFWDQRNGCGQIWGVDGVEGWSIVPVVPHLQVRVVRFY